MTSAGIACSPLALMTVPVAAAIGPAFDTDVAVLNVRVSSGDHDQQVGYSLE